MPHKNTCFEGDRLDSRGPVAPGPYDWADEEDSQ